MIPGVSEDLRHQPESKTVSCYLQRVELLSFSLLFSQGCEQDVSGAAPIFVRGDTVTCPPDPKSDFSRCSASSLGKILTVHTAVTEGLGGLLIGLQGCDNV